MGRYGLLGLGADSHIWWTSITSTTSPFMDEWFPTPWQALPGYSSGPFQSPAGPTANTDPQGQVRVAALGLDTAPYVWGYAPNAQGWAGPFSMNDVHLTSPPCLTVALGSPGYAQTEWAIGRGLDGTRWYAYAVNAWSGWEPGIRQIVGTPSCVYAGWANGSAMDYYAARDGSSAIVARVGPALYGPGLGHP